MNPTGLIINEIGPRIRLAIPALTPKEQQIARYCLALGAGIEAVSVHELAEQHEVSAAMLVKLAQHLGFSGFREFKQALVQYSQLPVVDLHSELNPNDDAPTVVDKVFSTAIHALRETMAILSPADLVKAAELIRNARTIDIYGAGGSGAMAADAHHRFLRIGVRTSVVTDSHLMVMSASLLAPTSVVLGFSHSGKTRAVIEAFRQAKAKGAQTILITNTAKSPLAECSDVVLTSVAQGSPITGENAAARVAQLCIFDALFVLMAQGRYEESLENLDKTIAAVKNLRS